MKSILNPRSALLLIDVINDFDFDGSERLLKSAVGAAERIAELKGRARAKGVPIIYVNDNFGRWKSDFREQIERCASEDSKGREVVLPLIPERDDYFILKPKHSGFYSTSLDILLGYLGIDTLILTGFAADICVLYTANDAYMRDFKLVVVSDGVAAEEERNQAAALRHMKDRLKARVMLGKSIR